MQVPIRSNIKEGKKGWIRALILLVSWVVIISLVKDLWQIKKGFSRIEESKQRLVEVEDKNQELKGRLNLVSTEDYKEQVMREQLNMQKVGEVVAVLPKKKSLSLGEATPSGEMRKSNWEKWWSLIN